MKKHLKCTDGIYRNHIEKKCTVCETPFWKDPRGIRRGQTTFYCSRTCFENRGKTGKQITLKCDQCGIFFERSKSTWERKKSQFVFCGRQCKDKAQSLYYTNCPDILPSHYGTGDGEYRNNALSYYGEKCNDCNITFRPILEVHHIDGNRENFNIENLEVLCPTHHRIRHLIRIEGRWVYKSTALTSKTDLENIKKLLDIV